MSQGYDHIFSGGSYCSAVFCGAVPAVHISEGNTEENRGYGRYIGADTGRKK